MDVSENPKRPQTDNVAERVKAPIALLIPIFGEGGREEPGSIPISQLRFREGRQAYNLILVER